MSRRFSLVVLACFALAAAPAHAGSHLWVIHELFSTADGSIQFVEMHVPSSASAETQMTNKYVSCDVSGNSFTFPAPLAGSTAFAYLLLATQAFADLPGAPTPDYIIPEGFFDISAETVRWWIYGTGDLTFGEGDLPLDGIMSLGRDGAIGVNSPTNFSGETGSVDASSPVAVPGSGRDGDPLVFRVLNAGGAQGSVSLELVIDGADASVTVFDASGRSVRRLFEGRVEGSTRLLWDGRDDALQPVASGVYVFRLQSGDRVAARKAPLIR